MDDGNQTPSGLRVETRTGAAMLAVLADLHRLRVRVFRDWPYLYDGSETYEASYGRTYADSPGAAVVVALDGDRPVGAATCLPLADESVNVRAPFLALGWDPAQSFYFGESVLLPEYRGQGVGVAFFQHREAHARAHGAEFACFCAVYRPPDHPARPSGDRGLQTFWHHRGYFRVPNVTCTMSWKEVGQATEMPHTMQFWMKSLREGAPP